MTKYTKYGLFHTLSKKVLGYCVTSNGGADFCNSEKYTLGYAEKERWLTDDPYHAEWVRNHSTPWYNSSLETPNHYYEADELVVVEIEVIESIIVKNVKLPSKIDIFTAKLNSGDKGYQLFINNPDEYDADWWQYKEYLHNKRNGD